MTAAIAKVPCALCSEEVHYLPDHLAEAHELTLDLYLEDHPDAVFESEMLQEAYAQSISGVRREFPPQIADLTVKLHGITYPVHFDVEESACLPLPDHYRLPEFGDNAKAIKRSLRYLTYRRSTWVHGGPGGGKDALPSAWSWWTRTPAEIFPINPNTDIKPWFFSKAFDKEQVYYQYGRLWECLVEGYVSPISGKRHPMLIVFSDFDRANRAQAEALRLIADSIKGRIKGPYGFYITANTMGGGDPTGRAVSANVIDSTIINRIERKLHMPMMDWRDEELIVRAKYPFFVETCGHLLDKVGHAVSALRQAISQGSLYAEFSHRDLCTWISDCEDIIRLSDNNPPADLLKEGFYSYADGLPDEQTKNGALTACDAHFKGGMLARGDTSGVRKDDLSA
jgi:hypothetical protein